jgi:hypothetical protein
MPELYQNDGNYEAYLSQLFNPLAGGAQFNPGGLGAIGTGIGGLGAGTVPTMAGLLQNPWGTPYSQQMQYPQQQNSPWPQQQQLWPQQQLNPQQQFNPFTQQNASRQAMQTIQHAQACQALKQLVQNLATQSAITAQSQLGGYGVGSLYGQIGPQTGQGIPQSYGLPTPNPIAQALQQQALQQQMLQQQALQQIAQYLATQQPTQFRYGLA